jgi:phospholipase C
MGLAAWLAGGAAATGGLFDSIERALAIEPATGSRYLDAEHVVILMQENRSFDHAYGTLRGVRGFNDPRAITLPDGNPVWVQANAANERFAPTRLDINSTKITWMGSLPHSWPDQVDARNGGLYDKWLPAKRSSHRDYTKLPLTMGYYTRADIPFYYALADAFTVCDQYFCSSLTGTTPNRCYLWSGTIRERQAADSTANLRNENVDHGSLASWSTFPERLEAHGISWKVYQNELTVDTGLSVEEDRWLSNFGDNPLEYFSQYHVHLSPPRRAYVDKRIHELPAEIAALKSRLAASDEGSNTLRQKKRLTALNAELGQLRAERDRWAGKSLEQLPKHEQALHAKAFCSNVGDPARRQLAELAYRDGNTRRQLRVPKGDVLHQFRQDVERGHLPTVSWIVSPEAFSDHPSSAWFGAWYIAEVLRILTDNPAVWKKTIFLLTYDENDGYFDHVPPFVSPDPRRPETGRVTQGIDASVEYVELADDQKHNRADRSRGGSIGLGYRVPMVIASPWSRGGCVCSQVFDHTSVLQFLEKVLTHRTGKKIEEPNISRWRRAVCGDLTASFQSAAQAVVQTLDFPPRDVFFESIHRAQFKNPPTGFHALSPEELEQIRRDPKASRVHARQESGVRPSCPLPYQLAVDGALNASRTQFVMRLEALKDLFGERAAGSPFVVYALANAAPVGVRNYAVEPGEYLDDAWALSDFANGRYHLRAYGPNGFFRELIGGPDDPQLDLKCHYGRLPSDSGRLSGAIEIIAENRDQRRPFTIEIRDNAYSLPGATRTVASGQQETLVIETQKTSGWYDFSLRLKGDGQFEKRYAGRVETGNWSTSDPAMA